jgi:hypothetical protein
MIPRDIISVPPPIAVNPRVYNVKNNDPSLIEPIVV